MAPLTLTNKTILITGATAGIGKACAELLAREGARLIITGRRADRLQELAATLNVPTHCLAFDIGDHAAMQAALASVPETFRPIEVLINNAGLSRGLEPADQTLWSDWEEMLQTNIHGLLGITREILPAMRAQGTGHVVNISSIAGTYPYAGANVYGASKAFVTYFSLALRADLLGSPVRVTNIEPGMTETEFSDVRFRGDQERASAVYAGLQPLTAEDIAETVRWALCQPAHVNINRIEVMPVMQAPGGPQVKRTP